MCGRYAAPYKGEELVSRFDLSNKFEFSNSTYNASPGQNLPVITKNSPKKGVLMKWGFIAPWEKDFTKAKFKPINARDDKLTGGFYRQALKETRCLIPCSGYYEWKKYTDEGKEKKQPYYFTIKKENIFSLGGIYSVHKDAKGVEHYFYCIITTSPNSVQKPIHDRMPLIIPKDKEEEWLDTDKPLDLVMPFKGSMDVWRVSTLVSSFRNDGPDLIKKE